MSHLIIYVCLYLMLPFGVVHYVVFARESAEASSASLYVLLVR